jgi:long-chain acyl-CoA synthetase
VAPLHDRTSLAEVFQETAARVPDRPALRAHDDSIVLSWGEYAGRVRDVAARLAAAGIGKGDGVALLLSTRVEFHVVDAAALHLGAYTTSIYATLPAADITHVLRDSGAKILITEVAMCHKAAAACALVPQIAVASVDGAADGIAALQDMAAAPSHFDFDFESAWRSVRPDDLAVLVYTSGTTGAPKGVELTHRAILGNQYGLNTANPVHDGDRVVSYLPMAHLAERHLSHYRPMVSGLTVTSVGDPARLNDVLVDFRPHHFFSPPRLYDKFRSALMLAVERGPADLRRDFDRMAALAARELQALEWGSAPLDAADSAQLSRLRASTGKTILAKVGLDCVSSALTGSAPVPPDILVFYRALGLPILEAWGQTECGAFGAFNTAEHSRVGTVGRALAGCEITLLPDGEILLKSPWLMRGYRHLPNETAQALDGGGWLHTGDLGEMSDDGFLKIVGRKKEIMINSFGKNMSPSNIENKLHDADPVIAHAVAIGEARPHVAALLVLDAGQLDALAAGLGIADLPLPDIVEHPGVQERVRAAVDRANENLSRVESVRSFKVLPVQWQPASDELTATMKLRRANIAAKYAEDISRLP